MIRSSASVYVASTFFSRPAAALCSFVATWLMHRELLSCTDWSGELSLSEIKPPQFMIGKNLVELALPKKYGIIVAAVRRNGTLFRPDPELPVVPDDILLIVSDESAIARLSEVR